MEKKNLKYFVYFNSSITMIIVILSVFIFFTHYFTYSNTVVKRNDILNIISIFFQGLIALGVLLTFSKYRKKLKQEEAEGVVVQMNLQKKEAENMLFIKTSVGNKTNKKIAIEQAFIVITPHNKNYMSTINEAFGSSFVRTNDFNDLPKLTNRQTGECYFYNLTYYYRENTKIGNEIARYVKPIQLESPKPEDRVWDVRFFVFSKGFVHRSVHSSFKGSIPIDNEDDITLIHTHKTITKLNIMKKLFKITLIALMSMFTFNSFSQTTLPYSAGLQSNPFVDLATWTNSLFIGTFDYSAGGIDVSSAAYVNFNGYGTYTNEFVATAMVEIPAIQNVSLLDATVVFSWNSGTGGQAEFYIGDGLSNWVSVPLNNISGIQNLTFQNAGYTFIKIVFRSTTTANVTLKSFYIDEDPASSIDVNVFSDYKVFSNDKTITVISDNDELFDLKITNLSGQIVFNEQNTTMGRLDLNLDLPAGVYIVNLVNKNSTLSKKVIIE